MGENRRKYLEMLQAVITRMAENQFKLRAWSVTLGTAVIGYAASSANDSSAAFVALLPSGAFWLLDGYYLALERTFRDIFSRESQIKDDAPSFSFDASNSSGEWPKSLIAPAVALVHLPVIGVATIVGNW